MPPGLRVVDQEVQVLIRRGVKRGGDQHGVARGHLGGVVLGASRRQQVLRPDEPLLPLGVEDAAGEGREEVPVGVGVDEGVTPQRALRRQRELAVGVVEHRDVVVRFGGGEGAPGLAQLPRRRPGRRSDPG